MHGKQCDASMKIRDSKPWHWHTCRRKPKWRIAVGGGSYLEYCERHKGHASDPAYMTPATFAKLEPI